MTSADDRNDTRRRGSVRARGASLQVRVYAGQDPVTGRDRYLTESVKGTDRAAQRRAEKVMTRLQSDVDKQRAPETSASLSHALDEWLRANEIEDSTRRTYVGYIERSIKPAIGTVPIAKLNATWPRRRLDEAPRLRGLGRSVGPEGSGAASFASTEPSSPWLRNAGLRRTRKSASTANVSLGIIDGASHPYR